MVELISSHGFPVFIQKLDQPSIRNPFKTLQLVLSWRQKLKNLEVDIVHANGIVSGRSVIIPSTSLRIPVLCHMRFPSNKQFNSWVFRWLPNPFGFIYISEYMKKMMNIDMQTSCNSSLDWVVHNGVNVNLFKPKFTNNVIFKIGVVANFQHEKGHEDLFEALRVLRLKNQIFECHLFGDDIQGHGRMDFLKHFAIKKGIIENVFFRGHVSNISEHIQQMDILVCPSHIEPFGRCIIEAMACGKAVLATNVGGIPEIVENLETGLLVPSNSPQEMAEKIEILIKDSKLRTRLGNAGRIKAESHFSQEKHVKKIIEIYNQVLLSTE